jgi:hypothetical protein
MRFVYVSGMLYKNVQRFLSLGSIPTSNLLHSRAPNPRLIENLVSPFACANVLVCRNVKYETE